LLIFLGLVVLGGGYFLYQTKYKKKSPNINSQQKEQTADNQLPTIKEQSNPPSSSPPPPAPKPSPKVKKVIKQNPPKPSAPPPVSASTQTNPDGSQTARVTIGGSGASEQVTPCGGTDPQNICFEDETGQNGALVSVLKNYLASSLRYGGELAYLYKVIIRNAGASGWNGYWSGGYTMKPNGDIVSAYGYIVLNTYYFQGSPYFNDYMKLTFSHEYGHHYTLYYKWVQMDLPLGVRLPDQYYTIRPLSKENTAVDYSLGWANCELEIIAEDYSYFYSGYGYHGMAQVHGYPSAATQTWIFNMPSFSDSAPNVSITSPTAGASLSGTVVFAVSATDDVSVTKVAFYLGDTLLFEDTATPYTTDLNTTNYPNGSYTLKAVAFDRYRSTTATINVTISN
jgi:hypothetical protein